jgi:hypothetical protein
MIDRKRPADASGKGQARENTGLDGVPDRVEPSEACWMPRNITISGHLEDLPDWNTESDPNETQHAAACLRFRSPMESMTPLDPALSGECRFTAQKAAAKSSQVVHPSTTQPGATSWRNREPRGQLQVYPARSSPCAKRCATKVE